MSRISYTSFKDTIGLLKKKTREPTGPFWAPFLHAPKRNASAQRMSCTLGEKGICDRSQEGQTPWGFGSCNYV